MPTQPASQFIQFLQHTRTLRWSGGAYVVLTVGFLAVMWGWSFQVIDELFLKQQILDSVAALSPSQKRVHIVTTATLDVAYPFAYGFFQAGMAYRYLGRIGAFIAPLSLLCIPVDLIEGFAQIMILDGQTQFVDTKVMVTPIKMLLYVPGLVAALIALGIALANRRAART